ncbi:MAG: hypothetical protein A2664_03175 [Candidatus Taylorbacteria bacterium RIFCSPHIGHO2_01_FULL_46_22b]|uniref:Uncharacterized protein n=1 Tax=Candidatus Taylorbacteria bacterium RIFCSPHIGHO2_01_FULL_46_22b TaxID=1802301 RepID=A0A1G2M4C7_9BACT|nr:MAG: hypothetical protein A2664_03175 [Candidatus Taylorbacteria bacterium RIFCSPHIGHO2_01_FULL_46_22b]
MIKKLTMLVSSEVRRASQDQKSPLFKKHTELLYDLFALPRMLSVLGEVGHGVYVEHDVCIDFEVLKREKKSWFALDCDAANRLMGVWPSITRLQVRVSLEAERKDVLDIRLSLFRKQKLNTHRLLPCMEFRALIAPTQVIEFRVVEPDTPQTRRRRLDRSPLFPVHTG